jgi:hypothetical protein
MPLSVKARSFLRNLFFSRCVDVDLDQEVHAHLELLIADRTWRSRATRHPRVGTLT